MSIVSESKERNHKPSLPLHFSPSWSFRFSLSNTGWDRISYFSADSG